MSASLFVDHGTGSCCLPHADDLTTPRHVEQPLIAVLASPPRTRTMYMSQAWRTQP
jgi:hypothetical protein